MLDKAQTITQAVVCLYDLLAFPTCHLDHEGDLALEYSMNSRFNSYRYTVYTDRR